MQPCRGLVGYSCLLCSHGEYAVAVRRRRRGEKRRTNVCWQYMMATWLVLAVLLSIGGASGDNVEGTVTGHVEEADGNLSRSVSVEPRLRGDNIALPTILPNWWPKRKQRGDRLTEAAAVIERNRFENAGADRKVVAEEKQNKEEKIEGRNISEGKAAAADDEKVEETTVAKKQWEVSAMGADGESEIMPLLMDSDDGNRKLLDNEVKESAAMEGGKKEDGEGAGSSEDHPDHYDGEEQPAEKKEEERKEDVTEMLDHILDRLEDEEDKGAGRFNETLEKKEAVLEWVARVGKHHHRASPTEENDKMKEEAREGEKGKEDGEGRGEGGGGGEVGAGGGGGAAGNGEKKKGVVDGKSNPWEIGKGEEEIKKDLPWLGMMLGGDKPKGAKEAKETKEGKAKNGTLVNGISSSGYKSSGELKELGEAQARQAKEEKDRIAKDEADKKSEERLDELPRLIDSNDNEYVISNPGKGSKMQLQEDLTLISDIVKVIVAAALGGLACGVMGQPLILGYLAAGMIVGPGGFRLIHELVQVETLAQFGVVFLLFALGIEFNLAKMQGCQAVALGGGGIQITVAMVLGGLFSTVPTQGIFIGAFLSMSSTAVVLKCLMDSNSTNTEYGQIMLGTLILQDCALGLLLAVMPALAAKGSSAFTIGRTLLWEVALLASFCALAWLLTKLFIPRFLRTLVRLSKYNGELYQLGCVGICLCVALFSEYLGLSLEVGAFVAGLMLSGGKHSEKTLHHVEPIRNIFAALFLASIGMVMHPEFLWKHKGILLTALAVVFFGKACLIALTVRMFGYSGPTAVSVGIALAQIGEFSFVLLSRAQALNLVSHKLYLLLMGTTALSLVLTPFAFKLVPCIVASQEKQKQRARGSNNHLTMGGSPEPPMSPLVMTTHRENDTMSMYKRTRGKPHGAPGSSSGNALEAGGAQEDEFEYLDEERRTPRTPSRGDRTPGRAIASHSPPNGVSLSGTNPGGQRGSPRSTTPGALANGNAGYGNPLSEILVEEVREEERDLLPSPARVMMRRPLGQNLPSKWKPAVDHSEHHTLHHR